MTTEIFLIGVEIGLSWLVGILHGCQFTDVTMSGEGCELGGCQVGSSILEEYPFIDVFRCQCFLIVVVQFFVVQVDVVWTQEVNLTGIHLDDVGVDQVGEVFVEILGNYAIGVDILDEEYFQHSFLYEQRYFLLAVEFLIHEAGWSQILPGVDEHKGNDMGKHTGVFNQLQIVFENPVLGIHVEQPNKRTENLTIAERFVDFLFEFEFLHRFFEFQVKRDQEADEFEEVFEVCLGLCVGYLDPLEEILQNDHKVVELVVLQELIQRQADSPHFLSLPQSMLTFRLYVV